MQPYFFPYIGYFQLITSSDCFVFYDDVQYSKGGWINRNRILVNGKITWITLPVVKNSHKLAINEKYFCEDTATYNKLLDMIERGYRDSAFFSEIFPLVKEWILFPDKNVASFNQNIITSILVYLGIEKHILVSSNVKKNNDLSGEERVLDICRRLGASIYVNPIGGTNLYNRSSFSKNGISLKFLRPSLDKYKQSVATWTPSLSILDVLMWNKKQHVQDFLHKYDFIG